jgi:hypothetical protein
MLRLLSLKFKEVNWLKRSCFNIEPNLDLEVYNLSTSDKVQAGEMIEAKYEIKTEECRTRKSTSQTTL